MPHLPTTRYERFLFRRSRYIRRMQRRRESWPRFNFADHSGHDGNKLGPPWAFVGDGSLQSPPGLKFGLRRAPYGYPAYVCPPTYTYFTTGRHLTPHVVAHFHDPGGSHLTEARANFQKRSVVYRGRKVDRLKGTDRICALAVRFSSWLLRTEGTRYWPDWDPLGRTPVWEG
jgi:hypothetical protein